MTTRLPLYRSSLVGSDWDKNTELWSPPRLVVEFASMTLGYVKRRWFNKTLFNHVFKDLDDLTAVALESLVTLAATFEAHCARAGENATSKRLFYSLLKQRIDWDIIKYLDRRTGTDIGIEVIEGDEDHGPADDWIRTQLSRYRPPSLLHNLIIDFIETMQLRDQIILALHYYEEMNAAHMETLTGLTKVAIWQNATTAGKRILDHALSQVVDYHTRATRGHRPAYIPPDALHHWVRDIYQTDLPSYLNFVARNYRADISYLIDFIGRAKGERHYQSRKARNKTPGLTTTDVA